MIPKCEFRTNSHIFVHQNGLKDAAVDSEGFSDSRAVEKSLKSDFREKFANFATKSVSSMYLVDFFRFSMKNSKMISASRGSFLSGSHVIFKILICRDSHGRGRLHA